MITDSGGLHFDLHAKVVQTPEEALGDAVFVAVSQVPAAEVVVVRLVAEHEVSSGQHGSGDRHDGLLRAAPALEPSKLRLQIAPVLPGRRPRGLDQRCLQPRRRVTDPGRAALARTLVEARAQARPRDQMSRTGKPRHVHADLGDEHPRDGLTDSGHRRQPLGGLAKRAQHLVGLLLQFLHGDAQRIDLPQVQLQQETVVRRHPAVHRGD